MDDISRDALENLVHREILRFDDELRCCVTLSHEHLYVCLTCGKCFSSGGRNSPLVQHFMKEFHTLALRMSDLKPVLLPDVIELKNTSPLKDVIFTAKPLYDSDAVQKMEEKLKSDSTGFYALESRGHAPGRIVVLRMLAAMEVLRDFFLLNEFREPLLSEFAKFIKLLFNPFYYRNSLSVSKLLRMLPDNDDPFSFLSILLEELSRGLGEPNVLDNLRIRLSVETSDDQSVNWTSKESDVWMLPLYIQDSPLYRDGLEKEQVIPRVNFEDLIKRYDGKTINTSAVHGRVISTKYSVIRTRKYLIFNVNRMKANEFTQEKSNAHVAIPFDDFAFHGSIYKLKSVISHEGSLETGSYVLFTFNAYSGHWLKCDAVTATIVMPEVVGTSQSCFLLFGMK